ncbi:porin [Stagnihabitans tardus]|uniref:Porin n=1 Tax=Stagnihabitans tardus TaxID=2699202 RepID=A0AAE5BWS4_9RHOB|nr:porin [Stagnihabitans tardus]NBZ88578.1 porin [Stagnihabitans tardus]
MKKILLATTVLAMTASVAAAEVAVSGSARMGIINNGVDTEFSSRVRIQFDGSGTTDGGLSFGASIRADQSGQGGTANGDSTVFVSGSFGKLTMGDVAGGAADNLVGQVSGVGYGASAADGKQEIGFLGGTATAARYDYTSGALSVSVGIGQVTAADEAKSIAVKYAPGTYSVAVGFSDTATDSQIDLLGSATFGAATVKARVADRDSAADIAYAVSLDYVTGAATITAFAASNTDFAGADNTGLGVSYDLGGGAAVKAGVVDANGTTVYDAGITMSF